MFFEIYFVMTLNLVRYISLYKLIKFSREYGNFKQKEKLKKEKLLAEISKISFILVGYICTYFK